jgi:drug/metabolite transporter (DMT)-like permease
MIGDVLGTVITPRFDSPAQVALNVVATIVLAVTVVLWFRLRRRGRRSRTRDLWLLVHFGAAGVYLPIGPLIWFARERSDPTPTDT